jgi:DNA-directed RNA polymerase specialized sigma subunit
LFSQKPLSSVFVLIQPKSKRTEEKIMGYNHAHELKLFKASCKRLRIKYRMAGMSEDAINVILQYDYEIFKSDRRFYEHQYSSSDYTPDEVLRLIAITDDLSSYHSRYWWIDEIDDPMILGYVNQLPPRDIELITLCVYEGYSQKEAAGILEYSEADICYRLKKIKKILKNISDFRI